MNPLIIIKYNILLREPSDCEPYPPLAALFLTIILFVNYMTLVN